MLRTAANEAGGFIASCRNPIPARMVAERAVLGGISQALEVGRAIVRAEPRGGEAVIDGDLRGDGRQIIAEARWLATALVYTKEAFDCGTHRDRGAGREHRRARDERVHGARARRRADRDLSRRDHDA